MHCEEGFLLQMFSINFNVKFQQVYFMAYLTIARKAIFIQIILSWALLHMYIVYYYWNYDTNNCNSDMC
jgi:hypothetical protein